MTNEKARKIIKQFRDRQGNSNDDIEAFDLANKALEKDIPKKPISEPDGLGLIIKVCPNCKIIVHDPDWRISTQKEYFQRRCLNCGQLFTELGKYIGKWEDEEYDDR